MRQFDSVVRVSIAVPLYYTLEVGPFANVTHNAVNGIFLRCLCGLVQSFNLFVVVFIVIPSIAMQIFRANDVLNYVLPLCLLLLFMLLLCMLSLHVLFPCVLLLRVLSLCLLSLCTLSLCILSLCILSLCSLSL